MQGRSQTVPIDHNVVDVLHELSPGADGCSIMRSSAPGRFIVGFAYRSELTLVAKVGPETDDCLANEAETLEALVKQSLPFVVPRVRWSGTIGGWHILALEPLRPRRTVVADELVLGLAVGLGTLRLMHGDLAPWNLLSCEEGLALIDWESASFRFAPMHDLAHFVIQRGALLGKYPPKRAARMLTGAGSLGIRYLNALGCDQHNARELLGKYLEAAPPSSDSRVGSYRRAVEGMLP